MSPPPGRVDGEPKRHGQVAPGAAGVVQGGVLPVRREEPVVAEDVVLGGRPHVVEEADALG